MMMVFPMESVLWVAGDPQDGWWESCSWGWLGMAGGWLSQLGISSPDSVHLLGAIQQCVLTGSQARGTGRSFPAFGLRLLQGEGGTGRAGLGCEG